MKQEASLHSRLGAHPQVEKAFAIHWSKWLINQCAWVRIPPERGVVGDSAWRGGRDCKPANIMRCKGPEGQYRYKLIDFGTATGALGSQRLALPTLLLRASNPSSSPSAPPLCGFFLPCAPTASDPVADGLLRKVGR